jgi:hypothetical protein
MALEKDKFPSYLQAAVGASSLRAPMKGEIYPITVTTSAVKYNVPDAWKGAFVCFEADGGDVYIQFATVAAGNADADPAARVVVTGSDLAPSSSGKGCRKVPQDQTREWPIPKDAATFAVVTSSASGAVLRANLAET